MVAVFLLLYASGLGPYPSSLAFVVFEWFVFGRLGVCGLRVELSPFPTSFMFAPPSHLSNALQFCFLDSSGPVAFDSRSGASI